MKPHELIILEIAREREKQIKDFGIVHDDRHVHGELAMAGATFAYVAAMPDDSRKEAKSDPRIFARVVDLWPKAWAQWHLKVRSRREDLVRAAALIVADIERLDRAAAKLREQSK